VLALGSACALLAGCTPAIRGLVGITLSDEGTPVAILAPCEGSVEGVVLFEIEDGGWGDRVGRWRFDEGTAPDQFDFLETVPPIWDTTRFEVSAWAAHPGWPRPETKNLEGTPFQGADLAQLGEGEVLYADPDDYGSSIVGNRTEFEAVACSPGKR